MAIYLPVLLVSVSAASSSSFPYSVPDDSALDTQALGQVDYLSHEWQEEDVWRSWRNMTRQKNEIANGIRLENASWRTWWKQRNKLGTVEPETLNWLKDSDVTWLYGPLHTALDWAPKPQPSVGETLDLANTIPQSQHAIQPQLPPSSTPRQHSHPYASSLARTNSITSTTSTCNKKPILKHRSICELLTSDLPSPMFSPPESEDEEPPSENDTKTIRPPMLHTKTESHAHKWRGGPEKVWRKNSPPRVHATFAEHPMQPTKRGTPDLEIDGRKKPAKHISFNTFVEQYISIEKPTSLEGAMYSARMLGNGFEDEGDSTSDTFPSPSPPSTSDRSSDDNEDENEVLEMRSSVRTIRPQARVQPGHRSSSTSSSSTTSSRLSASSITRRRSEGSDRERVTIAPIAPTLLKTTGARSLRPYIPPHQRTPGNRESMPVELVYVPTSRRGSSRDSSLDTRVLSHGGVLTSPFVSTPEVFEDEEEDAYDYFAGPDLGEDYTGGIKRSSPGPKYGDRKRRNSGTGPEMVLNGHGRPMVQEDEERGRDRSKSRSRTPSPVILPDAINTAPAPAPAPSATVTIPSAPRAALSPNLLSPPSRGRAPPSDSRDRGRSATRSLSERGERSSSRGTSSPIGSISPEGAAIGVVYAQGPVSVGTRRGRSGGGGGRRASSSSLSPESSIPPTAPVSSKPPMVMESPLVSLIKEEEAQARSRQPTPVNSPVLAFKRVTNAPPPTPSRSPQPSDQAGPKLPFSAAKPASHVIADGNAPNDGTLVERAVGVVSTALGAMWHSGQPS